MGRPKKQGFNFFSLDVDYFRNRKITNIRRAHGMVGVTTYIDLLCRIYHNGYYYHFDSIEELSMDIAEEIENKDLHETAARVAEAIQYLVERDMIDAKLFSEGIISSVAIQEQFLVMSNAAKRQENMDKHLLVEVEATQKSNKKPTGKKAVNSEENGITSAETQIDSETITQSKVNEKESLTNDNLSLSTRACAQSAPTIVAICTYLETHVGLPKTKAYEQALKFFSYNESLAWQCLPNWEQAAERWAELMYN